MKYPHTTSSVRGCTCEGCEQVRLKRRRRRKSFLLYGTSGFVPCEPVAAHLRALIDARWTQRDVSRAADIAQGAISEILSGHRKTVRRTTAQRILALPVDAPAPEELRRAPIGATRRLQALACLGWRLCDIEGVAYSTAREVRSGKRVAYVTAANADAIDRAYERLCMTPAPQDEAHDRARLRARREGWLPPLAWDDIDDPDEQPDLSVSRTDNTYDEAVVLRVLGGDRSVPLTRADRLEIVRRACEAGKTHSYITRTLGIAKPERYIRELRRSGWDYEFAPENVTAIRKFFPEAS